MAYRQDPLPRNALRRRQGLRRVLRQTSPWLTRHVAVSLDFPPVVPGQVTVPFLTAPFFDAGPV